MVADRTYLYYKEEHFKMPTTRHQSKNSEDKNEEASPSLDLFYSPIGEASNIVTFDQNLGAVKKSPSKEENPQQKLTPAMELAYSNHQAIQEIQRQLNIFTIQNQSNSEASSVNSYQAILNLQQQLHNLTELQNTSTNFKIKPADLTSNIKICDGSLPEKIIEFIKETDEVYLLKMCTQPQLLSYLAIKTTGRFRTWWTSVAYNYHEWKEVKKLILNQLIPKPHYEQLVVNLVRRKQAENESLHEFIDAIKKNVNSLNYDIPESELTYTIWSNVNLKTFKYLHVIPIPTTLEELTKAADTAEILKFHGEKKESSQESQLQKKYCSFHKVDTHNTSECRAKSRSAVSKN